MVERHKLRAARVDSPVLWTPGFRCFSIATAVAGVLLLLCIVIAVRSPSLATYDPYAVRGALRAPCLGALVDKGPASRRPSPPLPHPPPLLLAPLSRRCRRSWRL